MAIGRVVAAVLFCSLWSGSVSAQAPFTEEALSRGVFYVTPFGHWSAPWGAAVGLNDLDGDGDPDMVLVGGTVGYVRVLENDGQGVFTDVTIGGSLPIDFSICGISCVDYDADGDLDLYFSAWLSPNYLFRNDGGFVFTDVTSEAGVGDPGGATACSWGDYDGDGWLDLYVCNRTGSVGDVDAVRNELYHNLGDGTFEPVAAELGVDDANKSFQSVFFDHDLDGDLDLYVSNDKGDLAVAATNRLFENLGGVFHDASLVSGTGVAIDSMGVDTADFDRDGDLDIFCTNVIDGHVLFLSNGDGTYEESAVATGTVAYASGWGTLFWDFDNDAYQELWIGISVGNDILYNHDGVFPCEDLAPALDIQDAGYGTTPGTTYSAALGDIDGDGDLDLLKQTWNEPVSLFINHEGSTRNWLRLALRGLHPNLNAIGALVILRHGTVEQTHQLKAGSGYKGSSQLVIHGGLADSDLVEEVLIRWPDKTLSLLEDIAANQVLTVDQSLVTTYADCNLNLIPDFQDILADPTLDADGDGGIDGCEARFRRGDANADSAEDIADAVAMLSYLFGSGVADCKDAHDVNDDGSLDLADPIGLLGLLFGSGTGLPATVGMCALDPTADSLGCETPPSSCN